MKITVDSESDILYIKLYDRPVDVSETVEPGVVVDYDAEGVIVGVEIHDVSQRVCHQSKAARHAVSASAGARPSRASTSGSSVGLPHADV